MRKLLLILILNLPIAAQAQDCSALRRACQMKGQLGEVGEGNCQRYREQCARPPHRADRCAQLRQACMYKNEMGETGQGNCQRYREECR
jgi:hypothetical protein